MKRACSTTLKVVAAVFATAACALPQAYTISAKPGVVNYIEGDVAINGQKMLSAAQKTTFLNREDTLSTTSGKAEILLAPGVFLRIGSNSEVKMVSPSLTDTQLELKSGEAMIEADNVVKDSQVSVLLGRGSAVLDRAGLYRFQKEQDAQVAVIEGKLEVFDGEQKLEVGKGKEVVIGGRLAKVEKFDAKAQDDLYAWSNVRAQYDAASSYQAAREASASSFGGVWGGYGYSAFNNPGWFWSSGFNSWGWVPCDNAYFSPFGYGFYTPGLVGYAPVVYAPVGGGGGVVTKGKNPAPVKAVPVNPLRPPATAVGLKMTSPAMNEVARAEAVRSYAAAGGFRTATGAVVPAGHAAFSSSSSSSESHGGYSGSYSSSSAASFSSSSAGHSGGASSAGGGGGGHH